MYYSAHYASPIGDMIMISHGEKLAELWFVGEKYSCEPDADSFVKPQDVDVLQKTAEWLDGYFAGEAPSVSQLPLAPEGSAFRKIVWDILLEIPYGKVTTYGEVAKEAARRMGKESMSSQAVGGAVGHNPISVIIPCHRVIGSNGSLTGYAGGIDKKIALLELEGVDMSDMFVPEKGTAL